MGKIIHLLVTDKCDRDCKDCCNKQYDLEKVPVITKEELSQADMVLLTGGEPFAYANPPVIASTIKKLFPNVKKIIVYTNALELYKYIEEGGTLKYIDGLSISLKNKVDASFFSDLQCFDVLNELDSNRVYVFPGIEVDKYGNFEYIDRVWQATFKPADDGSIFRRISNYHLEV
jgi:molybdenum cofactor biosynthesis enzyme MoaA